MKMQIVACPRCGTYLFDDTAECHGCGQVLSHAPTTRLKSRPLPTDNAVLEDMQACPHCGETCRTGLVRCWNCSEFLRPEIEASYRKMRESGRYEVEHVELPILDASSVTEADSLTRRASTPESILAAHPYATEDQSGGDDFELSSEAQFGEDDYDNLDFGENVGFSDPVEESGESEVFRLQTELVEPPLNVEPLAPIEPVFDTELIEPPLERDEPPVIEPNEPPVFTDLNEPPIAGMEEPPAPEGEDLLKIAADEEQDIKRVRTSLRSKDSFVIFCPQGCRIRVKEKHRGKSGKCPRCQSEFVVPRKQVPKKPEAAAAEAAAEPVVSSRYQKWLDDIRLHTVDPTKLRIKVDSLLNDCQAVDLGFSEEDLLVATLIAGKFGANAKKIPPVRQAMVEHFLKQGTLDSLKVAARKVYTKDLLGQLAMAQPVPAGTESLFGDIPVFGTGRIAVRIPKMPDDTHPKYFSFGLSEFRAFVEALRTVCGIEGFGSGTEVPMTDDYTTFKCHLSQAPVLQLNGIVYYQKDPTFKLEVSGWRCVACGIVVSEAARAESKLGGANGKGIAKAKCPKCSLKYGNLPLYQIVGADKPQPASEPEPALA